MIKNISLFLLFVFVVLKTNVFAQSDARMVQSEFDRCMSVMERIERSLKRFENNLDLIKRSKSDKKENISREISTFENRLEYFRNRFERVRGQADKLRDDIESSGPVCPSCVESSVNLFCRSNETLQNDIDNYMINLGEIQSKMGLNENNNNENVGKPISFKARRDKVETLCETLKSRVEACNEKAIKTLYKQAIINLNRADSIYNSNETNSAMKALDISESLLNKIQTRCK